MQTEHGKQKPAASSWRRVGKVGVALVNPLSDLGVIYRSGVRPILNNLARARAMIRARQQVKREPLTWSQAVAAAGVPIEQLRTNYVRIRAFWWFLMLVCGGLSLILSLMLLASFTTLPGAILLRATIAALILVLLGAAGYVKALIATYRLWQLTTRRVSAEEKGTFEDFRSENRCCRQTMSLGCWR
ncbi:TPA: conjugal transfer protein TraX [Serratia marcescens]|nr:conjugal transfer protein TraX [Serratia marcescens]